MQRALVRPARLRSSARDGVFIPLRSRSVSAWRRLFASLAACGLALATASGTVLAQKPAEAAGKTPARGSIVEDQAAKKLLEAGDARYEAEEFSKAVEVWQSVIERYPRSKVRYLAHLRMGEYLLEKERAYDRARPHFESVSSEENRDDEMRASATLKMGRCFFEAGNFGKTFTVMRDVIEKFPTSPQVNEAYYYIGLGHFQQGHYSRAIASLERVGTALSESDSKIEKVEAGKRLYVKVEDADLAALEPGASVKVRLDTKQGDAEVVECQPVGRNVRVVLGSIVTTLGKPKSNNGVLEVRGEEEVTVTYLDAHTADRKFDQPRLRKMTVVSDALAAITDGAFQETLKGAVLGKPANLQVTDFDRDLGDGADAVTARVEVLREKTTEELETEAAAQAAAKLAAKSADDAEEKPVPRFKTIDTVQVTLTEAKLTGQRLLAAGGRVNPPVNAATPGTAPAPAAAPATPPPADGPAANKPKEEASQGSGGTDEPVDDGTIHTGVFRGSVMIAKADEAIAGDAVLQARPGDRVVLIYEDARWLGEAPRTVRIEARTLEGNLGEVRATRAEISDQELRVQTQLKTASALTNIGNRYKEFGLKRNAAGKYQEALDLCEDILQEASKLGGRLLEETYVQLWRIYFEMDKLELAASMCQRLQSEFPDSGFVDDALLQLANVTRKQGDLQRAVGIFYRLVQMPTSLLRGEAQFGIAECYEEMAKAQANNAPAQAQLFDRAFQEYKKVYDQFPESGRVGEAVAKMANFYYQQKDYARAVEIFDSVLNQHPDAKFLDVILFNYGRCLYRMGKKAEARQQFDQLISDFPESPLAADAKKISEALAKQAP